MQSKMNYLVGLFSIVMLSFFGSLVVTIGIMYISENVFYFSLEPYKVVMWIVLGLIFFLVSLRKNGAMSEPIEVQKLNHTLSIKRNVETITLDLNNIKSVILGTPKPRHVLFLEKFLFFIPKNNLYGGALVLKFKDNSYLVLDVLEQENGLEILNQILVNYQGKIVDEYMFTVEEKRVLNLESSNRVIII